MDCVIRGDNIKVTDALRSFIASKLSKLDKYFYIPTKANVVLSVLKDIHKVEVTILVMGFFIRAEESSDDMYTSVDLVIEKLLSQIRKYKTKMSKKFKTSINNGKLLKSKNKGGVAVLSDLKTEEEDKFQIVRIKRFDFKPMDEEEAILQMNMLGHNFFVFCNAVSSKINVIYKRKDGKYGLIESE